jgi:hypothetical protein
VLPSVHCACNHSSPQGLWYSCGLGPLRMQRCMLYKPIWCSHSSKSSLVLCCVIGQIFLDVSGSSSVSSWIASPWRWRQYYPSKSRELFTNRHNVTPPPPKKKLEYSKTPRWEPEILTWRRSFVSFLSGRASGSYSGKKPQWLPAKSLRIHHRIFHVRWSYIISLAESLCRVFPNCIS